MADFPSGNARQRRRIWRARGRLLADVLDSGRSLQGSVRWANCTLHVGITPTRPTWARRFTRAEWTSIATWVRDEYPMARAFRASELRAKGDEAGVRRLYGGPRG